MLALILTTALLQYETRGETFVKCRCGRSKELECFSPKEWVDLGLEERRKLAKLLSWDSLSMWEFDVFEVNDLLYHGMSRNNDIFLDDSNQNTDSGSFQTEPSSSSTLTIIGWAILGSPYSQVAMLESIEKDTMMAGEKERIDEILSRQYEVLQTQLLFKTPFVAMT